MLKQVPNNTNSKRSIHLLIDTMLELMSEKHFANITISELTRNAGLARNTFYAHFNTKEDVLSFHMFEVFRQRIRSASTEMKLEDLDFDLLYFEIWGENLELLHLLKENDLLPLLNRFEEHFDLLCKEFQIFENCDVSKEAESYANAVYADALASIVKRWMKTGMKETPTELSCIFKEFIRGT
ncbi:TetR/AcrR family transcriptional regulator [Cytobacillus spongiae]|uniref:TetR/AcrR family transcriptional regulator n=1 Tax=Cytobacillus spongiae TaxID=2901381 RepID=UPI001F3242D3|nr:TetR/AcrR family transcriptional regulator [Cytobacillus spongiae]UII55890.1 TetR/AcrR family transcriptional regulator [Cytobacillus spongiae]